MTDRELLELVAKAVGAEPNRDFFGKKNGVYSHPTEKGILRAHSDGWNPLTDDGDALRLAVKLKINLDWAVYEWAVGVNELAFELGNDPYAATRRAIVRAAAEIGKEMK